MIHDGRLMFMDLRNKAVAPAGLAATVGANITFSDGAAYFNGVDSSATNISVPIPTLNITTFSVATVINWSGGTTGTHPLFRYGGASGGGFSLYKANGSSLLRGVAQGVGDWSFGVNLIGGQWVSIILTCDPTNKYNLYMNGLLVANNTSGYWGTADNLFNIGRNTVANPTGSFLGHIKEISVYSRALNGHEIFELASGTAKGKANV